MLYCPIMNTISLLVYLFATVCAIMVAYIWVRGIEYAWCILVKHQAPFVASSHNQRKATAAQINQYYKNAKTIIEVGSGYGGLARYIARHTNKKVIGLENMPFCVCVARFFDFFSFGKSRTEFCDAFKYFQTTRKKIDVVVAYLGPTLTPKLLKYCKKIKVLISLNFEIPNITPTRIIDLRRGSVLYGGKKYPHKLFIYEFR